MNRPAFEIFDIFSGTIVAFCGVTGFNGVHVHTSSGWEFYPAGSVVWDNYHQAVYRNFRADSLTEDDLKERKIPLPPDIDYENIPIVSWKDNFTARVNLEKIPSFCIDRMNKWKEGKGNVFIVLEEDEYETGLGDGKFLDLKAAFWDRTSAERYLKGKERQRKIYSETKSCWYKHYLKTIPVTVDKALKIAAADLNIDSYEHYDLESIFINLNRRMLWEKSFTGSVPIKKVPDKVLNWLKNSPGSITTIYIVIYDDPDKSFTEEACHILEAAFKSKASALKYKDEKESEEMETPEGIYKCPDFIRDIQDVLVSIDRNHITADIVIDQYKAFSLSEILNML